MAALRALFLCIVFATSCCIAIDAFGSSAAPQKGSTRRKWLSEATAMAAGILAPATAYAAEGYDNPEMPTMPEERCE